MAARGRPRGGAFKHINRPGDMKKNQCAHIALTADEYDELTAAAEANFRTLSAEIRFRIWGKPNKAA